MGLFSSSKSNTTNVTNTLNAGFSDIQGSAVALGGDNNSVYFTDQGALKIAADIAAQAFGSVDMSNKQAAAGIAQAVEAVAESARDESENLISNFKTVAILGVLAWAAVSIAKGL